MMHILIVDDEPLLRMAVKTLFNWEEKGFRIVGEAPNGEAAVRIIDSKTVDILVTDIKMPVMNGLELIKYVEEKHPHIKTIVLSSYNDFEYVREALLHGAEDYILKQDITPEAFEKILEKIQDRLYSEENIREAFIKRENEVNRNFQWLKNEFFRNVIHGKLSKTEEIEYGNTIYQVGLKDGKFTLCLIKIDDAGSVAAKYEEAERHLITDHIGHMVKEMLNMDGAAIHDGFDNFIVIIYADGYSEKDFYESVFDFLSQLKNAITLYINLSVTIGVSGINCGIGEIPAAYRQSILAAQWRFYKGYGKIHPYQHTNLLNEDPVKKLLTVSNIKLIKEYVLRHEWELLTALADSFFMEIAEGQYGESSVKKFVLDLLLLLQASLLESSAAAGEVVCENEALYEVVYGSETLHGLEEFFHTYIHAVKNHLKDRTGRYSTIVCETMEQIHKYYDREISLLSISREINVNPSYLSRLFLHETGRNFIDYLTEVRIENAKRYLQDDRLRISEVAEKVGYPSAKYFNRIFKSKVGIPPAEFKKYRK